MAQFTLKIKTYDPDIVNAFSRLRKSRKQSAYTHEALKYFLATEQGAQVMALMASGYEEPLKTTTKANRNETPITIRESAPLMPTTLERQALPLGELSEDYCAAVLGNILK